MTTRQRTEPPPAAASAGVPSYRSAYKSYMLFVWRVGIVRCPLLLPLGNIVQNGQERLVDTYREPTSSKLVSH